MKALGRLLTARIWSILAALPCLALPAGCDRPAGEGNAPPSPSLPLSHPGSFGKSSG